MLPAVASPRFAVPPRGEPVLVHDATFAAWDRSFSAMRDLVNLGVDALNEVGAGLPRLPGGSLEELLVLPLTGDYGAIAQNATACRDVADALGEWAGDVGRVGAAVAVGWLGRAGLACALRLEALAVGSVALAGLVRAGACVLDDVAVTSERLGREVERLVVELGEALARCVRRLLTRVSGPLGWGVLAAEVALEGLSAVTDLVDDVRRVVSLVDALLDLRDTVAEWAGEQAERLRVLRALPDALTP
ncbi:hypothetical protein [Nocardioides sp. SYSU D00038]|uniref:hypothetical protein n=1 Tax=Nocardioides sp. SYSU D00038 TaxID=2812554 RepID=UPI0019676114|nr:hypothetical protein [Nocardioides sp. SYSU D00038]